MLRNSSIHPKISYSMYLLRFISMSLKLTKKTCISTRIYCAMFHLRKGEPWSSFVVLKYVIKETTTSQSCGDNGIYKCFTFLFLQNIMPPQIWRKRNICTHQINYMEQWFSVSIQINIAYIENVFYLRNYYRLITLVTHLTEHNFLQVSSS